MSLYFHNEDSNPSKDTFYTINITLIAFINIFYILQHYKIFNISSRLITFKLLIMFKNIKINSKLILNITLIIAITILALYNKEGYGWLIFLLFIIN